MDDRLRPFPGRTPMHFGTQHNARHNAAGRWRRPMAVIVATLLLVAIYCGAVALQRRSPGALSATPLDSDHLYNITNVWTIHLKFAPDQWEAMEPKGGFGPFGGGPRGNGPGGGRPGGRPGMFGGMDVPRTLTPVVMSQADLNRDGSRGTSSPASLKSGSRRGIPIRQVNSTKSRSGPASTRFAAPSVAE